MVSHITRCVLMHRIGGTTSIVRVNGSMNGPAVSIRRTGTDEPIDAPFASMIAMLGVLVTPDLRLEPSDASAVLTIPVGNVVLLEAFGHGRLPLQVRLFRSRGEVAVPAAREMVVFRVVLGLDQIEVGSLPSERGHKDR